MCRQAASREALAHRRRGEHPRPCEGGLKCAQSRSPPSAELRAPADDPRHEAERNTDDQGGEGDQPDAELKLEHPAPVTSLPHSQPWRRPYPGGEGGVKCRYSRGSAYSVDPVCLPALRSENKKRYWTWQVLGSDSASSAHADPACSDHQQIRRHRSSPRLKR